MVIHKQSNPAIKSAISKNPAHSGGLEWNDMLDCTSEPPPPMDETWWEAVMNEETRSGTPNRPAYSVNKAPYMEKYPHPGEDRAQHEPQKAASALAFPGKPLDAERFDDAPAADDADAQMLDWEKAVELYQNDQIIALQVVGHNRGGLLVNSENLQGFVPLSHLLDAPSALTGVLDADLDAWLENFEGRIMQLKIIECDPERGRIVFSQRAAQASPGARQRLLQNLQPGECVQGVVTNITDFGVFVDLGGVEGLVHVSEISWGRVRHPADVVRLGQKVDASVIHIDQEKARIALSLKRLRPNPWQTAAQRYLPGQVAEAVVTSLVPFGVFARLEEGLDGLIHISEMKDTASASAISASAEAAATEAAATEAADGPASTGAKLCEGQTIRVRILHVDTARQRLGLSLKLYAD